jgi:hypothetical protein
MKMFFLAATILTQVTVADALPNDESDIINVAGFGWGGRVQIRSDGTSTFTPNETPPAAQPAAPPAPSSPAVNKQAAPDSDKSEPGGDEGSMDSKFGNDD